MNVVVPGASPKKMRYSNRAVSRLMEEGHEVIPVNPGHREIEGLPVVRHLKDLESGSADTVTVYVNPAISSRMADAFLHLHPDRVIFNPGAENPGLEKKLEAAGIEVIEGCTLVMLRAGQF